MDLQDWVMIGVAFVAGSGLGTSGVLLLQWIAGRFDPNRKAAEETARALDEFRTSLVELDEQVANVDSRLDFTERLLGGALTVAPGPPRLRQGRDRGDGSERDGVGRSEGGGTDQELGTETGLVGNTSGPKDDES